jgi:hypothetical protein
MRSSAVVAGSILAFLMVSAAQPQRGGFPTLRGPYLGQKPPGMTPELFAPGIVSTCTQHGSAYFTKEGTEVYFSRMLPRPSVIMSMREENGLWTPPRVVCEGLTPGLAPDGRTVFFSTWELWKMFKTREGWTSPEKLGPAINFQKRQDTPYAAADGSLWFCSMFGDRSGIFRAARENEAYGKPERIEYGISSEHGDFSPCIAPDESYLVFASTRPGYGVTDLYVSFKNGDGSWTAPANLGPTINTAAKEAFPFVTFDGKYLFFMSNRMSALNRSLIPDGPGNVYWVDARVIRALAPARQAL